MPKAERDEAEVVEVKHLVKNLRKELKLTQKQLAALAELPSAEEPDDAYVARVETGANQVTSHKMRMALARGFGMSPEDFDAYIEGRISLAQAVRRSRGVQRATG